VSSLFENPSAGQFGPPPENAQREREVEQLRTARSAWKGTLAAALALGYLGLKIATRNATGWAEGIAVVLGLALFAAEHFVHHQIREEQGGTEPFSKPTHITR
jgi:hypothetical protein